jgi:hypothetical protein
MLTVTIRLMGGLGNQLFQYATARALALRHGAEVVLDLSHYEEDRLRRYELGSYPIAARIATAAELRSSKAAGGLRAIAERLLGRAPGPAAPAYHEPHFHFDPLVLQQRPPVHLIGYWQSERYFVDAAEVLRREFSPQAPLEPENARIAAAIATTNAVSLHVRRGDYVSNAHTNAYHGVCSLDYYRAAVAHIRREIPDAHLFVFSDDHEWTRRNLAPDLPTTYVTANPADRGFRDLQLMSRCRHHVVANSSFSWWGAWLNPSPDKMVIAPARWFASAEHDTRDLVPATWLRL